VTAGLRGADLRCVNSPRIGAVLRIGADPPEASRMTRPLALAALALLAACSGGSTPGTTSLPACVARTVKPVAPSGWSADFAAWLGSNGYAHLAANQGYGGGVGCVPSPDRDPLVFLHGNSNAANPTSMPAFRGKFGGEGYTSCDMYAITWLPQNANTGVNHFKGEYLALVRDFISAVLAYTGKEKVDVVAWSMGVDAGRKAIAGGTAYEDPARTDGCELGPSLAAGVDTYLAVAGSSRGVPTCAGATTNRCSANGSTVDSAFLRDLNGGSGGSYDPEPVASVLYSIFLPDDEYICGDDPRGLGEFPCEVFGVHTSHVPGESFAVSIDIDNTKYDFVDTNYHCVDTDGVVGAGNCDHGLVFQDPDALGTMLRLLRDNDTSM
jgi:hypothetical protein